MAKRLTKFTPEKRRRFLAKLEAGWSVSRAARAAGTQRQTIWEHRRNDPVFERQCAEAYQAGIEAIDDSLVDSGYKGDTTARIFVLKSRDRAKYGDRVGVDFNTATPEQIERAILSMSDDTLRKLIARLRGSDAVGTDAP